MSTRTNFLIISDLHVNKGYDPYWLQRFMALAVKSEPDYLVFLGDLGDFDSKAKYIKDRTDMSPEEEVGLVMSVLDKEIFKVIKDTQNKQRRNKKKLWKPQLVCCMGNHDARVEDILRPALEKRFNAVVDNRDSIAIGGVLFSHTFDKGITGTNCKEARDILLNTMTCTVSGHSHVRDWAELKRPQGTPVFAIKAPCATQAYPDWAGHRGNAWSRGFVSLQTNCILGEVFDYHFVFFGD